MGQNRPTKKGLRFSKLYKKWYFLIITAVVIAVLTSLLGELTFFEDMEKRAFDYRFILQSDSEEDTENVVIIAIDESSLNHFARNNVYWPWPREYYAVALEYFAASGAKSVVFDIMFFDPDYHSDSYDRRLADNIASYGKAVLAAMFLPDATEKRDVPERISVDPDENIKKDLPSADGIALPLDIFLNSTDYVGTVNVSPDSDGVIRRVPLFHNFRKKDKQETLPERVIPQLAMSALFTDKENYSPHQFEKRDKNWYFNDQVLPMDEQGNYLINWYGGDGPGGSFTYYPFRSVIQSYIQYSRGETPVLPPDTFKGKHIIIGATAPGLYDLKATPISQVHPGMEIWATVLNNFLTNDFISLPSSAVCFVYLFVISFLLMVLFINNPLRIGNLLIVLLVIAVFVLPIVLWSSSQVQFKVVSPLTALIISFMYITTSSYLSEGKSKKEIKRAFSRYLHPEIIEQLISDPDLVDLEGKEFEATMIFTDIYNFTNFSENTDPKKLIVLLNRYFETLTGTILDNEGMLDKFMGDGLMAVFGAPLATTDHAYNACKAALQHKNQWRSYSKNSDQVEDYSIIFHTNTRIGVNTGPVVAGNMGSVRRVDYTVIGDAVNLAARLESINKYYKTDIIISEFTYERIKDRFICRELDSMKVKGKSESTKIYELLDFADAGKAQYSWIDEYVEALDFYRQGRWDKAISILERLACEPVNDQVAKIMLDRCLALREDTPKDWNGIYIWEVK